MFRYEPYVSDGDDRDFASHIVTVVTLVSCYQYIILAVVFSKGAPYRLSIFTNCEYAEASPTASPSSPAVSRQLVPKLTRLLHDHLRTEHPHTDSIVMNFRLHDFATLLMTSIHVHVHVASRRNGCSVHVARVYSVCPCVADALLINLLLAVAATAWITLYPLEWLIELMEVRTPAPLIM